MRTITRNNHQLGSYELNKLSLCHFDDKRYIHMTYYGILQNTKLKQEKQWFYTKAVGK